MLHLPETRQRTGQRPPRAKTAAEQAAERRPADDAAHRRLCDLECPISGARTMSSVLSVLASKLAQEVISYRGLSTYTADRMAQDIDDAVDRVLYVAYEVEQMLRNLEKQYLAPLDDEGER